MPRFSISLAAAAAALVAAAALAQNPPAPAQPKEPAKAEDPSKAAPPMNIAFPGDAYILDIDIVTGEKLGEKTVPSVYMGRRLQFANEANAKKFAANPSEYMPKLDEAMIKAQTPYYPLKECVVSGHGADGEWLDVISQNRLYRLCCTDCEPMLRESPGEYLAKLDAAVIAAQKPNYPLDTCPISGKKLGSMGEPKNVVVGNRLVRLCCSGCMKKFMEDPRPAIAKIDAATKK